VARNDGRYQKNSGSLLVRHAFDMVSETFQMTRRKKLKRRPHPKPWRGESGDVQMLVQALRRRGYVRIRPGWPGITAERGRWRFIWCSHSAALEWLAQGLPRRFYDRRA